MTAPTSPASNRWSGQWIWDREPIGTAERQVIAARTVVQLQQVPEAAPGRIFADSLYVLFVNGQEIRRGPGRANPHSRRFDPIDLAPALREGDNVLTIVAALNTRASRNWMPAPTMASGLNGGALAFEADLGLDEMVGTDGDWLTTTIDGWTLSEPTGIVSQRGLEVIDATSIPGDLHAAAVTSEVWRPATVKSGRSMGDRESVTAPSYPYGPTRPSTLAPSVVTPRQFSRQDDGLWLLDDVGVGTLVLELSGPAGATVDIETFEILEADGEPRDFHEEIGLQVTVGSEPVTIETLDLFGLRGFKVVGPPEVTVHRATLNERHFPLAGNSRFACNDTFYDDLYWAGRRTVTMCSHDAYVDNPTREGRAWTGDSVVHQMVDFASNGDWSLARWNPLMGALSQLPDGMIPAAVAGDGEAYQPGIVSDWGLHWTHAAWNIYRFVGDVDETARLLPSVERVVQWFDQFTNPVTGLPTDVVGWALIDWSWVVTKGTSSVVTALLGRALRDLADMADFVGDTGTAERARRRHAELSKAFELFWDPELERYADNAVDGARGETASVHAQAAAIVAGFAPQSRYERLVDLMTDRSRFVHATLSVPDGDPGMDGEAVLPGAEMLIEVLPDPWWNVREQLVLTQPFFRYVVHDALVAAGRPELVLDSLRDWSFLLERNATSFGEMFWGGVISQGWSSTPTRDLVHVAAGVTPAEPGYAVVGVNPSLGDLEWVEAVVPTPAGEVTVKVDRNWIEVESPRPLLVEGQALPAGAHRVPRASQ